MRTCSISRFGIGLGLAGLIILYSTSSNSIAAVKVPGNHTIEEVDFERHVMGLFGRMGCNSGSCHGSFQGKGGLRLSLFGYEPSMDYYNLTRGMSGRRLNVNSPAKSLMLLKASGQVAHGGAVRFSPNSWQFKVIEQWLKQGAKWTPGSGDVEKITISPPELAFANADQTVPLKITARFQDGAAQEITPFCEFRTLDDAVADVTELGEVTAVNPGSTAVIVKYRGSVIPVKVLVPTTLPKGFVYPKTPTVNYIDEIVFARLKKLNIVPSELSSDTEFLRRVYIDTIGRLPEPDEVRSFLKDKSRDKRARIIDKLLDDPMHAALWATKYCDITGNDTTSLERPNTLQPKLSQMWHEWFKKRFHENMPYDEIVRGVLTATSREGKSPGQWMKERYELYQDAMKGYDFAEYANRPTLDLFWARRQRVPIEQWGEKTAAAFMGIRVECAQCHKHPFDRWTQEEYRAYANIFTQVAYGTPPESRKELNAFNKKINKGKKGNRRVRIKEVYVLEKPGRGLNHPETNRPLKPKALGGPEFEVKPGEDLREKLFEWLRQPDNPFFAPSFVNRVWGHYFGQGIVDPVDDFSLANPPSNEALLQALAKDFLKHKFDIRHIERVILNSRAYQLSSKTNETNELDKNNFSHAYVRPMMAEVVVDVINSALDAEENFGKYIKRGVRAIEVGPSVVQGSSGDLLRLWGRPPRTTACDCERGMDPGLPNKLYLMTNSNLMRKLTSNSGRLMKLLKTKMRDEKVLEELFLATVSRYPTENERNRFAKYLQEAPDRRAAFTDALWALINTKEFIFNH